MARFFVSDGYRNTRVVKFAPDGRFLLQWGTRGSGPGQFDLVRSHPRHSGRVYVSDRSNDRVQIFDERGNYLGQWKSPEIGRPHDIAIAPDDTVFIADGGEGAKVPPNRSAVAVVALNGAVSWSRELTCNVSHP